MQLETATGADVRALVRARDDAARWMVRSGIAQWRPGEVAAHQVRTQVRAREWLVVRDHDGSVTGGLRLLDRDVDFWGPRDEAAAYVHGLMVVQRGQGLGSVMLAAAESEALLRGARWLRLDHVASNTRLAAWYAARGFDVVGGSTPAVTGWRPVTLRQRALSPQSAAGSATSAGRGPV